MGKSRPQMNDDYTTLSRQHEMTQGSSAKNNESRSSRRRPRLRLRSQI